MKPNDIGKIVYGRMMRLVEEGHGDYWKCFHAVLDEDTELKAMYAGLTTRTVQGPSIKPKPVAPTAGLEIDRLVRKFMNDMNIDNYEWALRQILKANPHLTKRYAQS